MRCGPAGILEMEIDLAVVRCGDQAAGPVHVRAGRRAPSRRGRRPNAVLPKDCKRISRAIPTLDPRPCQARLQRLLLCNALPATNSNRFGITPLRFDRFAPFEGL